jgi:hypothetical protein
MPKVQVTPVYEDWMNRKWRPFAAYTYMVTCIFDFIVAPILWSIAQAITNGGAIASQWNPLTLQGAGLYHIAMGAVLGISAWTRGQEKIAAITSNTTTQQEPEEEQMK